MPELMPECQFVILCVVRAVLMYIEMMNVYDTRDTHKLLLICHKYLYLTVISSTTYWTFTFTKKKLYKYQLFISNSPRLKVVPLRVETAIKTPQQISEMAEFSIEILFLNILL